MYYEIILDRQETANKCTIAPLLSRPDFRMIHVKGAAVFGPLTAHLLLHHEGKCLTQVQDSISEVKGIASIDCVWSRLDGLMRRIQGDLPLFVSIPAGFQTAYPRRSAKKTDPEFGLATIEALFVAVAVLGQWDSSLFEKYYFGREFIEVNKKRFLELGVFQVEDEKSLPVLIKKSKNSLQRKRDRGIIF